MVRAEEAASNCAPEASASTRNGKSTSRKKSLGLVFRTILSSPTSRHKFLDDFYITSYRILGKSRNCDIIIIKSKYFWEDLKSLTPKLNYSLQ